MCCLAHDQPTMQMVTRSGNICSTVHVSVNLGYLLGHVTDQVAMDEVASIGINLACQKCSMFLPHWFNSKLVDLTGGWLNSGLLTGIWCRWRCSHRLQRVTHHWIWPAGRGPIRNRVQHFQDSQARSTHQAPMKA